MGKSAARQNPPPGESSIARYLERSLSNSLDGVMVLDRNRRFVAFSKGAERITGYTQDEVIGSSCSCHGTMQCQDEHGRSLAGFLCPVRMLSDDPGSLGAKQRMRLRRKDGGLVWVETVYTALRSADGAIEAFIGVLRDVSDSHDREQELIANLAELRRENATLTSRSHADAEFDAVVSRSPSMQPVLQRMRAAIATDSTVLISGPRGAGKGLIARTIHAKGARKDGPFVLVAAAAISKDDAGRELFGDDRQPGAIRAAEGGSLYIDDVAELPHDVQARLAQFLAADVAATRTAARPRLMVSINGDAETAVREGRLRPELCYRLNAVSIELPPLRDRREDIPALVQHFLDHGGVAGKRAITEVSPRAWTALLSYSWPGNVAELASAVRSAQLGGSGPILQAADLPPAVRAATKSAGAPAASDDVLLDPILEQVERQTILEALRRANGQRNRAAQMMGISRSRLYRRMDVLGITPSEPADSESR